MSVVHNSNGRDESRMRFRELCSPNKSQSEILRTHLKLVQVVAMKHIKLFTTLAE